ncbi:all-trans-retinol 13,14-reductase [Aureococcus anophagefferens]|nr:all-trans-retinol 13,14-reductase [Aureococcus anophagefferens]
MMRVILALAATTTTALVAPSLRSARSPTRVRSIAENVAQTQETSRDKVMTFSYDTERERAYEKPTYKGTGDGMGGGDAGDAVRRRRHRQRHGGLACGAMCAKYGEKAIVLESHIKMGGSAHSFTKVHNKENELPVETYQGLAYWVPTSNFDGTGPVKYWRFQLGDVEAPGGFYESLREHASDGELAIKEFEALRSRLKTLGGSTTAVCLFNLRQDPASSRRPREPALRRDAPRRLRGPALTFDSLHKTVDQLVTEPFLRNFIDTMCIFCGFPPRAP